VRLLVTGGAGFIGAVYLYEGLADGFVALQDNSTVMYLCSAEYSPQREHTIAATDPALAIDLAERAGTGAIRPRRRRTHLGRSPRRRSIAGLGRDASVYTWLI